MKKALEAKALDEFIQKATLAYEEAMREGFIEFDGDEELGWYDWADNSTCELCDDLILEHEAIVYIQEDVEVGEWGAFMTLCEYCLNPDLN